MMDERKLIFIISLPRSGSTLVQHVLSNHESIQTNGETWFLLPFMTCLDNKKTSTKFGTGLARSAIFNDFIPSNKVDLFNDKFKEFLLNTYSLSMKKYHHFFIDKTPRYYEIALDIYKMLPYAKYIVINRNPADVANSVIQRWGKRNFCELYYFYRDLIIGPKMIDEFKMQFGNNKNVYLINYEDIVEHPEIVFKKIFNWLGLGYQTEYLNINSKRVKGSGFGDNKILDRKSINNLSINQWKKSDKATTKFIKQYIKIRNDEPIDKLSLFNVFKVFSELKEKELNGKITVFEKMKMGILYQMGLIIR